MAGVMKAHAARTERVGDHEVAAAQDAERVLDALGGDSGADDVGDRLFALAPTVRHPSEPVPSGFLTDGSSHRSSGGEWSFVHNTS
jgi:hypothetical protein